MRRLALTVFLPLLLLSCFALPAAQAAEHARSSKVQKHSGYYLTLKQIPPTILPPPPARNSRAERQDLRQIIDIQKYVAEDEIAAARDEHNLHAEHVASVLGESFTRQNLPFTFALLDRAGEDTGSITWAAKKYWHTTRPYWLDKRIKLQVDALPRDNYGYPSGHTSTSHVWAQILTALWPNEAGKLEHQADRIAMHRMIAGVHTSHDISGGHQLGEAIFDALLKNDRFLNDLEQARIEVGLYKQVLASAMKKPKRKNWKHYQPRTGVSPLNR